MIHDIKKYKALKIIYRDLKQLASIVDLNMVGLKKYEHYVPVAKILNTLREQQTILNIHLSSVEKELNQKGKINE